MINEIYWDGKMIIESKKIGRKNQLTLSDGTTVGSHAIYGEPINIICHECGHKQSVKFYGALFKRFYICQKCTKIGIKNPFYGKKHTMENKKRLSANRIGTWGVGENNSMYGINVWDSYSKDRAEQLKKKISDGQMGSDNHFFGKTHTEATKIILAEKSRARLLAHPEYLERMRKGMFAKMKKGFKTSIEKIVHEELNKRGVKCKYSKILHRKYQYDFIIGDDILLEVHGDYWHANPKIYKDKDLFSKDQKIKIELDIKKKLYAEQHGYKIFYIWETDVRKKDFTSIQDMFDLIDKNREDYFTNTNNGE